MWSQNIAYYIIPFSAAQATKQRTDNSSMHVVMDMNSSKLYSASYNVKMFSIIIFLFVAYQDKFFYHEFFHLNTSNHEFFPNYGS